MSASFFSNFGMTGPVPAVLHPIMDVQRYLIQIGKREIPEVAEKLLATSKILGNFDDISTNICDFSYKNSKYNNFYVELCVLLAEKK
jgi:hypothetical protein